MEFQLNIKEALDFFDGRRNGKYSNTIVVLLGEETCAYLFKKFMTEEQSLQTEVFNIPCKKKGNKGKQLDRWIRITDKENYTKLYQTEIKTWNSNGAGGKKLELHATLDEINNFGLLRWEKFWRANGAGFESELVDKVLHKMDILDSNLGEHSIFPLLLHWGPICNIKADEFKSLFFFEQNVQSHDHFDKVYIFSVSIYLRYLFNKNVKSIALPENELPLLYEKMRKISLLITKN